MTPISTVHYYEHHIGDYAKDTGHLSITEHGAYRKLLDWCYASERALPDDLNEVFRIAGAIDRREKAAAKRVVEEFFNCVSPDGRRNKRAMAEIARFKAKSSKARESVAHRWQSERNTVVDTNVSRTQNDGYTTRARVPLTNNQEPITRSSPTPPSGAARIEGERIADSGKGDGGGVGEVPADEAVFEFGRTWAGEPASGLGPVIPPEFIADWLKQMHGRREFPPRWPRALVAAWRAAWRERAAGPNGGPPQGAEGGTARRIRLENEIEGLTRAIAEHVANRASAAFSPEHTEADREDLAEKKRAKKERETQLAQGGQE